MSTDTVAISSTFAHRSPLFLHGWQNFFCNAFALWGSAGRAFRKE